MSLIYFLFDLFCDNNIYSQPQPPPPQPHPSILSRLKLWFNFILGLNVIFFCFQLIPYNSYHTLSYITIPKNLPTSATWEIACQGKQRCQPQL